MCNAAELAAAAPVDALLLAQSLWSDDQGAIDILLRYCDPYAVARQLSAWLRVAVEKALEYGAGPEFGDTDEFDVIARWINDIQTPRPVTP